MAKAVRKTNSKREKPAVKKTVAAPKKAAAKRVASPVKAAKAKVAAPKVKPTVSRSAKPAPAAPKQKPVAAVSKAKPVAAVSKAKPTPAVSKAKPVAAQPKPKLAEPGKKVSKILITQPKPEGDKSPYYELARKYKLELEFHPFIRVEGVSGRDFRRQRVEISAYTAIIFTSRSAVDHFFRIQDEMKSKVSQEMKYCCLTEAVALYLQKFILYRKRKVFFSADGSTQGLLDVIGKHKAEKYILPTSDSGKNEIHNYLTKYNIPFAEVTLYHTVPNDITKVMKKGSGYDMIVFFSPFSVQTLFSNNPKFKQNGTVIGAFGPTTSKAVEDSGLRLDVKAPAPNAPSMVSALEKYLESAK